MIGNSNSKQIDYQQILPQLKVLAKHYQEYLYEKQKLRQVLMLSNQRNYQLQQKKIEFLSLQFENKKIKNQLKQLELNERYLKTRRNINGNLIKDEKEMQIKKKKIKQSGQIQIGQSKGQ